MSGAILARGLVGYLVQYHQIEVMNPHGTLSTCYSRVRDDDVAPAICPRLGVPVAVVDGTHYSEFVTEHSSEQKIASLIDVQLEFTVTPVVAGPDSL